MYLVGVKVGSDCILSTDEKTTIQARRRIHPTVPPAPARPMRVEHEYQRRGAWAYLAAWDVRGAKVFGRCETTTGIRPFGRLVAQVMRQEPYRSAPRVFWIMDNGSSHRGHCFCLGVRVFNPLLMTLWCFCTQRWRSISQSRSPALIRICPKSERKRTAFRYVAE